MPLLSKLKKYSLFLFIFSIPFEYWDPWGVSSFFTISKMAGLLYFAFSLTRVKSNFALRYSLSELKILFTLLFWITLMSLFYYTSSVTISIFNSTFLQCIVLFWLMSNEFSEKPKQIKYCLLCFVLSVTLMSIMIKMGIGLGVNYDIPLGESRVTFFGTNPNSIGNWAAISIILIMNMLFRSKHFFGKKTLILILCIPNLILMLGASGSRGAFVVLFIGLFIFFIFYKASLKRKLPILIVGIGITILFSQLILNSDIMNSRMESTINQENLGGRSQIWAAAFHIFGDSPLWGYGISGYQVRMIQEYGKFKDTHNVYLYFMVTGGIIGLTLFLFFLYMMFRNSVYKLKNEEIVLPLCLLIVYMAMGFKSGGFLSEKLMWVILAYIACKPYTNENKAYLNGSKPRSTIMTVR